MYFNLLLPSLVSIVGLYLLIRLRFFFFCHPIRTTCDFVAALSDREARRSFFLALAGTLGVGNIFGVAAGIMIGGAGSLFWLFISGILSMVIKYAETLMVFDHGIGRGGMSAVLKRAFSSVGGHLSRLYALFTLLLALSMGSAMQSAALVDVAEQGLSVPPIFTAVFLVILLIPCIIGKAEKIESITEIIIPMTTIIYIIMCFTVIFLNFSRLGDTVKLIVSSAFSFRSIAGGGLSFVAVKEGFARGIMSNEAGAGTSAMAHARAVGRSPHTAGLFAMCEVLFDSTLLCTLTGLAILVSLPDITAFSSPMSLVNATFSGVGGAFSSLLPFIILAFAYSTVICWYFYGSECVEIYFPRLRFLYPIFFITSIILSAFLTADIMISFVDLLLLLMTVMTLSAIIKSLDRLVFVSLSEQKDPEF